jgi:hypothetical protein
MTEIKEKLRYRYSATL